MEEKTTMKSCIVSCLWGSQESGGEMEYNKTVDLEALKLQN